MAFFNVVFHVAILNGTPIRRAEILHFAQNDKALRWIAVPNNFPKSRFFQGRHCRIVAKIAINQIYRYNG